MEIVRKPDDDNTLFEKKWKGVIEKNIEGLTKEQLSEVCRYCENQIRKSESFGKPQIDDNTTDLLSMALRLISKLDLKDKRIISMDCPRENFIDVTDDGVKNFSTESGTISVQFKTNMVEIERTEIIKNKDIQDRLIEKMAKKINLSLRYYDTICIYDLTSSYIMNIDNKTFAPIINLSSRVCFLDKNNSKEIYYTVEKDDNGNILKCEIIDLDQEGEEDTLKVKDDNGNIYLLNKKSNTFNMNVYNSWSLNEELFKIENDLESNQNSIDVLKSALNK